MRPRSHLDYKTCMPKLMKKKVSDSCLDCESLKSRMYQSMSVLTIQRCNLLDSIKEYAHELFELFYYSCGSIEPCGQNVGKDCSY
jgi:hypothetical protein